MLAAGCGGSPPSAQSVVRAWSQALNAEVIQAGRELTLRTHADAVAWNASLPCSGKIVSIDASGDTATATFLLGNRRHRACDGPGQHATAIFKVLRGKIVLWHQTPARGPTGPTI